MKLFKSLLVAPATLGLLAPMSVTANELNIKDVSGYSSSEEEQFETSAKLIVFAVTAIGARRPRAAGATNKL